MKKFQNRFQETVLKEIQHNDITSLHTLKAQDPNFHWSSLAYEKTGDTALHIASSLGYLSVIDYLLKEYNPCAVNIKNKDDKTPLHDAAQFTQLESVSRLCQFGAEVNALRRGDWTALMLACTKIQPVISLTIVKALVENGAEINLQNKDGWSCVHILAREGGEEILDYLISQGLNVNVRTKNGRTALHIATLHGNIGLVSRFLNYINIESRDSCGNSSLHEAIIGQHINIAKLLVKQGADINSRNNSDLSILHVAACQESPEVIDYVLNDLKFDINCLNKNGWTVAHCAARKGSKMIFEYLKTAGADLSIKDNFGRTAIDYFLL